MPRWWDLWNVTPSITALHSTFHGRMSFPAMNVCQDGDMTRVSLSHFGDAVNGLEARRET